MDWPTAAGVGAISVAMVTLVASFVWLVVKNHSLGVQSNESRAQAIEEERLRKQAEDRRDELLKKNAEITSERDSARRTVEALRSTLTEKHRERVEELKKVIDENPDQDPATVAASVFGRIV